MATKNPERREKIVMLLGIAAIILFSANLLSMLAKHFWPDYAIPLLHATKTEVVEFAPRPQIHILHAQHMRHRIVFYERNISESNHEHIRWDIDLELERIGRELERSALQLDGELSLEVERGEWKSAMKTARRTMERVEKQLTRHKIKQITEQTLGR